MIKSRENQSIAIIEIKQTTVENDDKILIENKEIEQIKLKKYADN